MDISFSVTSLNRFVAHPREGHLKGVIKIYSYLKKYSKKGNVINSRDSILNTKYEEMIPNFGNQYSDFVEEKGPKVPEYFNPSFYYLMFPALGAFFLSCTTILITAGSMIFSSDSLSLIVSLSMKQNSIDDKSSLSKKLMISGGGTDYLGMTIPSSASFLIFFKNEISGLELLLSFSETDISNSNLRTFILRDFLTTKAQDE